MPTLIDLVCEIARSKNLDTSDVVAWALHDVDPHIDFRNPISADEFRGLVTSLQAAGSQQAYRVAKQLLEDAYTKLVRTEKNETQ